MAPLALLAALACRPAPGPDVDPVVGPDTSPPTSPASPPPADPFAAQPDTDEGLVNVSADLQAVLEGGALVGACDRYASAPDDRRAMLLCGKSMFFYEGFDTLGIPAPLFDFVHQQFTEEVGPGYSGLGLVVHPNSPEGRPIGFGDGSLLGDVPTLALTCASCHFAQLPDGRYAVGAPNHGYQYGRHMLALLLAPAAANPTFQEGDHHPDALAAIRPMLDRLDADPWLGIQLGIEMLPLLDSLAEVATLTYEQEGRYASWPVGTMDFMIAPVPLDDGVHTVSKISPLWGIPTAEEQQAAGMRHAMLGWTGGTDSVDSFLAGFVVLGDGGGWTPEALVPLREYVLSLRAPAAPDPPDPDEVARGAATFVQAGCLDCHQGPRGSGLDVYTYEEIGTDDAMAGWADGPTCCDIVGTELTHGIKSPRLVGMWAQSRFLHNGSVASLDALLCRAGDRPTIATPALSDGGHAYGCDLPDADRGALIAYLLAH